MEQVGWRSGGRQHIIRRWFPFVFHNVDLARSVVGDGPERYALAEKMSTAWVSFARTGDPNIRQLPKWEPFTMEMRATMIFNNECRAASDPYC